MLSIFNWLLRTSYKQHLVWAVFIFGQINSFCSAQNNMPNTSSDTLKLTLKEAIDYGLQRDLGIKNNQLDVTNTRHLYKQYRSAGLPQINGSLGYQYFLKLPASLVPASAFGGPEGEFTKLTFGTKNNLSAGIEVGQLIFSGQYFVALEASRKLTEQATVEVELSEKQLRDNITEAYFGGLAIQENIKAFKNNITILEKLLNETQIIQKAGFIEELDVDRLKLALKNLNTQLQTFYRQADYAHNILKMLISADLEQPIKLTQKISDFVDVKKPLDLASLNSYNRLEFKRLDVAMGLNELDIKQIKQQYYPTVAGFFSAKTTFQANDLNIFKKDPWIPTSLVGFNVNIPIFDGQSKKYQLEQRYVNGLKIQNGRSLQQRAIELEIAQAKIGYQNAWDRLQSQQEAIDLAQKIYNTITIKYKAGIGSSFELTDAEQKLFENQNLYINALYDLLKAQQALQKALGN